MSVSLKFLGAAGTVTGSKYLLSSGDKKLLIDAGLFQGERSWREKNWLSPQFDPAEIDAVLLTHAHLDHIGMLPRFWRQGQRCPIYCTKATSELSAIILPDSARLQEEEAQWREHAGRSRHHPPLPLYNAADAAAVLKLLTFAPFNKRSEVLPGVWAEWRHMGHILGAASIRLECGGKIINFSGDVGRYGVPLLCDPDPVAFGDLLLVESTYGDRDHSHEQIEKELASVINATQQRGGIVLIPSFAVGRAQLLLYYLRGLKLKREIPDLPVIVDSPMAQDATQVYRANFDDCDQELSALIEKGGHPFEAGRMRFIQSREESKQLNQIDQPMVLISASGMLSGGRILHHLKHRIADPRNSIVFVGYQPPGGRGAWIQSGAKSLRVLGEEVPIRAEIHEISSLSAHADRSELLRWCRSCSGKPGNVAVVHGEPDQSRAFAKTLETELGWGAFVAVFEQELTI